MWGAASVRHSPAMRSVLERLAADPAHAGLFLDFDGTLAPIIDDPPSARMIPEAGPIVADLARRLGLVAVVSGRPAAFLGERAAIPRVRLLGLYGLEEWVDGQRRPRPETTEWAPAVARARVRLRDAFDGVDGVLIEDKALSVAVHWRNAADRDAAGLLVDRVVTDIAVDTGLAREPGKLVEELRPPVAWDKGATVRALADELELGALAYVGDDRGDLPAFEAVQERGGAAIVVAQGLETPPVLLEIADVVLQGAEGVVEWLRELRDAVG